MSYFGVQINVQLNRLMFDIRIHLAKNKYMPNIRTLYRSFTSYDPQVSGLIASYNFEKALNSNGIFLKKYDVQVFEKAYNQNGKINWFSFLSNLRQPMGPNRKLLVQKIFDSMDVNHTGKINTQDLMSHFNFNQIETYRYGKKTKQQISQEFLSMIHTQEGQVTRDEFINFYNDLNINFGHNQVFVRYVSSQWFYTPEKQQQVRQEEIRQHVLSLRNKLLEKTQGSKDQLLVLKIFKQYDVNKNSYLGQYDLDLMIKNLGLKVQPRLILGILQKIDKNQSGYIEFEEFKKFLYHHPYPY